MPDTEGKMSPEEQKKAIDWLNRKAPNMVCPACKHSSFAIVEHILTPQIHYGGSIIMGGPNYPQFMVVCNNCSHMLTFSAIASGVIPKDPSDGK
ncbi:hypothetical protein AB0V79_08550 [Mesorhizobium ciceri]|uniref:hypothetical protein n=1 Tax=Mesorhizobium TaxID=68287 RepID=UPI0007A94C64|nr:MULTISPECIES: hypothetical protein [Mesorhizobium]RVA52951.1 hypothetical protein EN933_13875 [Mesorhizobium sp. M7A.F.Ca.US.001.01.1.1]TIU40722.1 MAG: hypothetical protein E5W26_08965 [Mesorhizobium sp.]AMY03179.1 hypothetical protein A4R29_29485 [Mesorhizobium ciceri biovar biserrulae]ARP62654.1 hypothetical protein A9K65_004090 [Mesorhizobium sp. WSM1497]MBZ9717467.1 hypothetical protein [Mesorhizobium sp. AD1-1]